MNLTIHPQFQKHKKDLVSFIRQFASQGILFGDGQRNKIKLFELDDCMVNIKSFKVPNLINKVAYRYFRKSKAKRSFEFATLLLENGIGTPIPIAFAENFNAVGLKDSYYLSEHLECELTYRELVQQPDYPNHEEILRQFTKFTFDLHQKGIEFLDHSPGNTLIKKSKDNQYEFFLVDLNRMIFHTAMDFDMRMKNFHRLTPKKEMLAVMSDEYSKLYDKEYAQVYERMCFYTDKFQEQHHKKMARKKKLLFWR